MNTYDDIINLSRPKSNRNKMSMYERAAQFAPFASLRGYSDEVYEVSRYTKKKVILDDEKKEEINSKLQIINNNIYNNQNITITYFMKDKTKEGGTYITYTGILKKIDTLKNIMLFKDEKEILINNIIDIKSDMFTKYNL